MGIGHIASQYLNQKIILLKDNGDIGSASEDEINDSMPSLKGVEEDVEYQVQREVLVIKRILNVQIKQKDNNQRESIFYTRCLLNEKVYSLLIDGGTSTNVTNTTSVDKFGLTCVKYSNPYTL